MTVSAVIGIDPGLTGAIVCVRPREVLTCLDMPIETGAANRRRISAPVLVHLLTQLLREYRVDAVALEQVAAMPGQGVSSMFSFGRSLGVVEGAVAALGLEVTYYAPASWKRRYGLTGRTKEASRTRALELYPAAVPWLERKKDHGRADAILLAHTRLTQS
jgi:crossover junction endodeoxyribonuclease RuvC